jgi:hypothetical protein
MGVGADEVALTGALDRGPHFPALGSVLAFSVSGVSARGKFLLHRGRVRHCLGPLVLISTEHKP